MANPYQLGILTAGVECWNRWRAANPTEDVDLTKADLKGRDLTGIDLRRANLAGTQLREAKLIQAKFPEAKLSGADLRGARLAGADLSGASLDRADLCGARISMADLNNADLRGAMLDGTIVRTVNLSQAILTEAILARTVFADVNLSEVRGLESVIHYGPSTIGIDTLYKSRGAIPDRFLRDAGVPEEIIDIAHSIRTGPPIQWYSCFISYSTEDEEFARRLHSRMREANMRVWFAPEDLKGGKKLHEQLFEAIQIHDRLLLVLSENSIKSEWVMTEIRKAREVEKKEQRRKLFPIRLTDFETLRDWHCFDVDTGKDLMVEVREYFIPDFSNWKDHDAFEAAFARLQEDLKNESKPQE